MPDPDIEIRRRGWGSSGGGSSRPLEKRGGADSKKKFSVLGLKTSGGGGGGPGPSTGSATGILTRTCITNWRSSRIK